MARTIQIKRGLEKNLPVLKPGEQAFTTDTKKVFIGSDEGNIDITNSVDTTKLATKTELSTVSSHLADTARNPHELKYRGEVIAQSHGDYAKTKRGCVVFTDDGAKKPLLTIIKPVLDKHGVKISIAKELNTFNEPDSLSMEDLKMFYREGHEIMSHSVNHRRPDGMTEQDYIYEFEESKRVLKENGMNPTNFVYPYNEAPYIAQKNVLKYYRSASGLFNRASVSPPLAQETLPRVGLGIYQEETIEALKLRCLDAKNNGKMMVFMTHTGLIEGNVTTIEQTTKPMIEMIEYCVANGVDILTMDQALDRIGNIYQIGTIAEGGYQILGADKKIYTDLNTNRDVINLDATSVVGEKPPSFYNQYHTDRPVKIYMNIGSATTGNANLPVASEGVLITEKASKSGNLDKQEFRMKGENVKYVRFSNGSNDTWTQWFRDDGELSLPSSELATAQPPSYFNRFIDTTASRPTSKVREIYYRFGPNDTTNPNLPVASAGVLKVTKVSGSYILDMQQYRVASTGVKYERYGLENNTWTNWQPTITSARNRLSIPIDITVAPNSNTQFEVTGLTPTANDGVIATPKEFMPYGVYYTAYHQGSKVFIQFSNVTGAAITITKQFNVYLIVV